jgi:hypothetical protein
MNSLHIVPKMNTEWRDCFCPHVSTLALLDGFWLNFVLDSLHQNVTGKILFRFVLVKWIMWGSNWVFSQQSSSCKEFVHDIKYRSY